MPKFQKKGSLMHNLIQSSTVKTRSNLKYYIQYCDDSNINYHTSNSQQTLHSSPSRASYGVSIMGILKKIGRVITVPHCMYFSDSAQQSRSLDVHPLYSIYKTAGWLPVSRVVCPCVWSTIGPAQYILVGCLSM